MAKLILVRHGESEWNALELWTGWTDVSLTERGKRQAREAGGIIQGMEINLAYVSALKRSVETLTEIENIIGKGFPVVVAKELNERDYGDFTGRNKVEIEDAYGYEVFEKWHRGWDFPLPHGETLKDVYNRTVPYFQSEILTKLKTGKNVLVSAHGNSLRALVKYLENLADSDAWMIEIPLGGVLVYEFDNTGKILRKEIKGKDGSERTIPLEEVKV